VVSPLIKGVRGVVMKLYYNQQLTTLSRELRKNSTLDEVLLWKELKNKKTGYPFMRQKPILSYIVDFYCAPLRLAIEIDGSTHDVKIESDIVRQSALERDCCRMAKSSFLPRRNKGYLGQKVTKTLFGNSPRKAWNCLSAVFRRRSAK